MDIKPFETEHFFERYEFNTPYQLCNSDCESLTIAELLELSGATPEDLLRERLVYTDPRGQAELREAIAELYRQAGPDDVLLPASPVEGIYLAARALLEPGDEVVVLCPAYDALINLFEHVAGEAHVKRWSFRESAEGWQLDLDDLRELITARTRLVVVNFPHNPTGYLPSAEFLRDLTRLAEQHGAWLFSDEMYAGLVHDGTPPIPSAADLAPRTVVLSGLSKTYGLPGLRCGWLVVRDSELRATIMNWKYYTSICPPVPNGFLAIQALKAADRIRQRNLDRIHANLNLADAFFDRWGARFTWRRPRAGSTALVGFDVPSVDRLSRRLAEQEGILIQSGKMLGGDDRHMRIGLGRARFGEALGRFENWLHREFPDR